MEPLSGLAPMIPWDPNMFYDAIINLRQNLGTAINIGLWIFITIFGVRFVVSLITGLGK